MDHFKHPLCTRLLNAAPGDEDVVAPLWVQDGSLDGARCVRSFWRPDALELLCLNQGGTVSLSVLGQHPPLRIDVQNPEQGLDDAFAHDEALLESLCQERLERNGPNATRDEMKDIAKTYAMQMLRRYGR